jgi:hypothetical protein
MEADYPAAHSMDTTWFAVDRDGRVGMFDSGENGAVPQAAQMDLRRDELLLVLRGGPPGTGPEFANPWEEAARLGVFYYAANDYPELPLEEPYPLVFRAQKPLHVDSLPPKYRKLIRAIRFEAVRFEDSDRVQPVEHVKCAFWNRKQAFAYLAADGVTVRPIPGRERSFAVFCFELRRDCPEVAARLRFEGPDEN